MRRISRVQYHKACKSILRNEGRERSNKMAEALTNCCPDDFWNEVKKCNPRKSSHPVLVDGCVGKSEIAGMFANKISTLYNSIGFDADEISDIANKFDCGISKGCSGKT